MAVVGVDTELIDNFVGVFAPVPNVDQGVVERRAVIADKVIFLAEGAGGRENVWVDDFFEKALKFPVGQLDAIESLELITEILLQRGAIANILTVFVF